MIGKRIRTWMAVVLVVWMTTSLAVGASETAIFYGRASLPSGLTQTDASTVIALVDSGDGTVYRSEAIGDDGSFVVEAPAGTYSVLAESGSGAYLAEEPVTLNDGVNPAVALRMNAMQSSGGGSGGGGGKGGLSRWGRWLIVGGIAVAAFIVIDDVSENVEEDASPF